MGVVKTIRVAIGFAMLGLVILRTALAAVGVWVPETTEVFALFGCGVLSALLLGADE